MDTETINILGAITLLIISFVGTLTIVAVVVTEWRGTSAERVTTAERTAERIKGKGKGTSAEDTAEERILAQARQYVVQDTARFARDHLVRRKQYTEFKSVYAAFCTWCKAGGISPPSPQQFSRDLGKLNIERGRRYVDGVQRRVIVGRRLNQLGG